MSGFDETIAKMLERIERESAIISRKVAGSKFDVSKEKDPAETLVKVTTQVIEFFKG